ncbi:DUF397 domain-containing protein [Nocardia sp. NPDC049707]|uniref:DUF397 domain-containing protein n=1 Tax=Nocardia sp. NPDC049707 TaxID=3154735 RepID=UPI0034390C4F
MAFLPNNHVDVHDSKNPSGPTLVFTQSEWSAFTAARLADTSTADSLPVSW